MADYVSNYSGDQIDEAVGRALPGGALDTGKAPAGFGLGVFDQSKPITKEELDLPKGNGWYFINAPYSEWSDIFSDVGVTIWGVVRIEGINANFCRETIFDWYYQHTITRTKIGVDDWEPWEWVNPPMQLGVEYRTTERYMGKPVYARVINAGYLPNASSKYVEHGIANIQQVVDAKLLCTNADVAGDYTSVKAVTGFGVDKWAYYVDTADDRSTYTANIVMKYTKTTD